MGGEKKKEEEEEKNKTSDISKYREKVKLAEAMSQIPIIEQELNSVMFHSREDLADFLLYMLFEFRDKMNLNEKKNFYAFLELVELLSLIVTEKETNLFPDEVQ